MGPVRSRIESWHWGKLVLLWGWGAAALLFGVELLGALPGDRFVLGSLLLLALAGVPLALSVITWKWLGGKERRETRSEDR